MKKSPVGLLLICALLVGCVTPSVRYAKLSPLTELEKQQLTCVALAQEASDIKAMLNTIGEVSTADAVMANVGMSAAILRATLGGYNSKDLQLSVDVREQRDAVQKANVRLADVALLQADKQCGLLQADGVH